MTQKNLSAKELIENLKFLMSKETPLDSYLTLSPYSQNQLEEIYNKQLSSFMRSSSNIVEIMNSFLLKNNKTFSFHHSTTHSFKLTKKGVLKIFFKCFIADNETQKYSKGDIKLTLKIQRVPNVNFKKMKKLIIDNLFFDNQTVSFIYCEYNKTLQKTLHIPYTSINIELRESSNRKK